MTAVAPPPNVHSVPRQWGSADIFVPRATKGSQQRYGVAADTSAANGFASNGIAGGKKKGTTRASSIGGSATSGSGAGAFGALNAASNTNWKATPHSQLTTPGGMANGVSAAHQPGPILPSQHLMNSQLQQQNGGSHQSYLMLLPLNGTFERKQIQLPYYPETLRIGRQTNAKTIPTPNNGYFDSKVLSRQHAEVWADKSSGRVWIRDIKSSNGTFVNGQRLSQENQDSEPHELRAEDVLELGIDIVGEDNKTIVHHKVAARVEHAGLHGNGGTFDVNFDIDPIVGGSPIATPIQHGSAPGSLRGRSSSQGSRTSSVAGVSMGHRQAPMMIPPVTMEMVVKKLNFELAAARQQSQDLQKTSEVFDVILADMDAKPRAPAKASSDSEPKGLPALASQPTIELSRSTSAGDLPRSKKFDKPAPPQQLLSLVDALAKARKEVEAKSARVSDLEDALKKERIAREVAEDRAAQLENASRAFRTKTLDEQDAEKQPLAEPTENSQVSAEAIALAAAEAANRHQKRMEEMMLELQAAKDKIEVYKQRTENAEKETESTRKSLSEMVQKIRKDEEARQLRIKERGCQTDLDERSIGVQTGEKPREKEDMVLVDTSLVDQRRVRKERTLVMARTDAAPYASVVGVMLFGVGLMALLNGWQKGER